MDRAELESLDRESLVARAQEAGIRRARILTRPELVDELLRLDPNADEASLRRSRGFFGRARDLLTRVVERGLHLPDAIDRIRSMGPLPPSVPRAETAAVPTVTLAEIYAAQGHKQRAIETLRRVLDREPDHAAARALLAKLEDVAYVPPPPPLPPEPEVEPAPQDAEEDVEDLAEEDVEDDEDDLRTVEIEVPTIRFAECVGIPLGRGAMHVSWRVPRSATEAGARFVVRAAIITPTWDGPTTETRDVEVDARGGELVLSGLPERAVVRVAVGVVDRGRFSPLAHSPAIEPSDAAPGALVCWSFRGSAPVALDDPHAAAIARAANAARRAPPA